MSRVIKKIKIPLEIVITVKNINNAYVTLEVSKIVDLGEHGKMEVMNNEYYLDKGCTMTVQGMETELSLTAE